MKKVIFFHGDTVLIAEHFQHPTEVESGTVAYNGYSDKWYQTFLPVTSPGTRWTPLDPEQVDPIYRMKLLLIT